MVIYELYFCNTCCSDFYEAREDAVADALEYYIEQQFEEDEPSERVENILELFNEGFISDCVSIERVEVTPRRKEEVNDCYNRN